MLDYSYRCQMLRVCILSEFMVTRALWLTGSEVYTKDCYYCQRILPISYKRKRSLSWAVISTLVCNYAGSILRPAGTTWSFVNWFLTTNSSLNSWVLPLANTRSPDIRLCSWNGKASQESQKYLEIIAYCCWFKKARPALRHLACNNKHCLLDTKIFSGESRCYPSGGQTWKMEGPMPELLKTDSSLGCNNFWIPNFRYRVSDF